VQTSEDVKGDSPCTEKCHLLSSLTQPADCQNHDTLALLYDKHFRVRAITQNHPSAIFRVQTQSRSNGTTVTITLLIFSPLVTVHPLYSLKWAGMMHASW